MIANNEATQMTMTITEHRETLANRHHALVSELDHLRAEMNEDPDNSALYWKANAIELNIAETEIDLLQNELVERRTVLTARLADLRAKLHKDLNNSVADAEVDAIYDELDLIDHTLDQM